MNNPRAHIAHILMAAGGALLALSTFLGWLEETSLWEAMSFLDIVIFLLAIATAALAVMHITGAIKNQPVLQGRLADWLGLIPATLAIGLVLEFTFGPTEAKFGAWIGFLASLAIIAGLVLREKPELADRLNEATANIGSGGGPGGPGGHGGAPQGVSQGAGPGATTPGFGGQPGVGSAPAPAATPPASAEPLGGSPLGGGPQSASPQSGSPSPQSEQPQTVAQPTPAAQPAQQAESSGPAPGWYPDPQGQKRLRYWDGGRWTEQTAD